MLEGKEEIRVHAINFLPLYSMTPAMRSNAHLLWTELENKVKIVSQECSFNYYFFSKLQ